VEKAPHLEPGKAPHPAARVPVAKAASPLFPQRMQTMIRRLWPSFLLVGLSLAAAAARAEDNIKTKAEPLKGVPGTILEESPKGILLKGTRGLIPVADILDVLYDVKVTIRQDFYRPALASEAALETAKNRKAALADAVKKYQKLLDQLPAAQYP